MFSGFLQTKLVDHNQLSQKTFAFLSSISGEMQGLDQRFA